MALPWYLVMVREGRLWRSWLLLLFMISGKENMGFWVGVIAIAALVVPAAPGIGRRMLVAQSLVAFGWSVLITTLIMPAIDADGHYQHAAEYSVLGGDGAEILATLFTRPLHVFRALFEDIHGADPQGTAIKLEFHFLLLVSGGWAFFRRSPFLLMALPLIAQKMFNDHPGKWGLFAQYSVEFAMLLPLATASVIGCVQHRMARSALALASCLMVMGATIYMLDFPLEHQDGRHGEHDRLRFYQARHFKPACDTGAIDRALALIPDDAGVSALSPLVPHLIRRHDLYQYPIIGKARFIVLLPHGGSYPMDQDDYLKSIADLENNPEWMKIMNDPTVLVFERRQVDP
jgi:hypothetical protein